MSTSCEPAISAHINRHAKAAFGLELIDLLSTIHQVPYIDSSIICRTCEILSITAERDSPNFSSLVPIDDLSVLDPFS